jgi:hypothetical protein
MPQTTQTNHLQKVIAILLLVTAANEMLHGVHCAADPSIRARGLAFVDSV